MMNENKLDLFLSRKTFYEKEAANDGHSPDDDDEFSFSLSPSSSHSPLPTYDLHFSDCLEPAGIG